MCPTRLGRNGEAEEWGRCRFTFHTSPDIRHKTDTRHEMSEKRYQTPDIRHEKPAPDVKDQTIDNRQ